MALFKKNPNEVNYPDGKKTIISMIKNEGNPDMLIWKVPYEDFNTHSQVKVDENEEALFVNGGVVEGVLTGGTHDLKTGNYPFISRLRNSISGGVSIFNCKVYFINKSCRMNIRWGTQGTIKLYDVALNNLPTEVTGYGTFRTYVNDSKLFWMKFSGLEQQLGSDAVEEKLRGEIQSRIQENTSIALKRIIKEENEEIANILSDRLSMISDAVKLELDPEFEQFGLLLDKFSISSLDIKESEDRKRILAGRAAKAQAIESGGQQTYAMEQSFATMQTAAANPGGAGGAMGAGMGLGMGLGMGASMYNMAQNMQGNMAQPQQTPQQQPQPATSPAGIICPSCNAQNVAGARFCNNCGAKMASFCPTCGVPVTPGSRFCSSCGGKIE
jgi:membrane protease subunit (stomatin/prohibitin family)